MTSMLPGDRLRFFGPWLPVAVAVRRHYADTARSWQGRRQPVPRPADIASGHDLQQFVLEPARPRIHGGMKGLALVRVDPFHRRHEAGEQQVVELP